MRYREMERLRYYGRYDDLCDAIESNPTIGPVHAIFDNLVRYPRTNFFTGRREVANDQYYHQIKASAIRRICRG